VENREEIRKETQLLTEVLHHGSAEQVLALSSPISGGSLEVRFHDGERLAINVSETNGDFRICLDGLPEKPDWVDQLGNHFVTIPSK